MAIGTSPTLKRNGPFATDDEDFNPTHTRMINDRPTADASAPADASARVSIGYGQLPGGPSGAPALTRPAPPGSPATNDLAAGTLAGSALNRYGKDVANTAADTLNSVHSAGADVTNAITYPMRAAGGFIRDAGRAIVGMAPSPDAGNPVAGASTAPLVRQPFQPPPIDFQNTRTDVPVAHPNFAGVQSQIGSSAPTSGDVTDPARSLALLGQVANTMRPFLQRPGAPATSATASATGIDTGTTVGGRTLPYGAMVNGVPTFSDGSGTGGIPRTMSDATIKGLGDRLPTAPAQTSVLASDVLGRTPAAGEGYGLVRAAPPITGSRPTAQQFADADRNAIALRDPRSAAGIAARGLAMETQYGRTPRARAEAAQSLAALDGGTQQGGLQSQQAEAALAQAGVQGDNALRQTQLQGQNALAAEDLRGRYGLQNTGLEIQRAQLTRAGHPVTLEDGTMGVMDPITATVTRSRQADGTPAKALVSKMDAEDKRSNQLVDQLNRNVQEQMKNFFPSDKKPALTPTDIQQMRKQAAMSMNLPTYTNKTTGEQIVNINGQWMPL
ncbi:hypothetical protein [Dyella sp. 2RAB6]|uniref:hypothetical protein n=1 Tax=Dyella sp. 2RAB6 TaxID=3232992 RepID=UPI003F92F149